VDTLRPRQLCFQEKKTPELIGDETGWAEEPVRTWCDELVQRNQLTDFYFEQGPGENIWSKERKRWETGKKKQHNEELHKLYSSPNIIRMIKSRRMRWAVHVARMGEKRNTKSCTCFEMGSPLR
jgi:hypothetical protein